MSILVVSPTAEEDLEEIWAFVAQNDAEAANHLLDEITSKFDRLLAHPELGRSRHELLINLRSFPVRNYLIFYQPFADGVEIFRVLHGSRELERVFDELIDRAN